MPSAAAEPGGANATTCAACTVQPTEPRPWIWRLVLGHGLLALLAPLLAGWLLWHNYLDQQERALVAARSLATLVKQDVAAEFSRIDLSLLNVKARLEDPASPAYLGRDAAATARLLADQRGYTAEMDALRLTDAKGRLRHGLDPGLAGQAGRMARGAPPVDLADRDYFVIARDQVVQRLIVSEPLTSRVHGQPVLILARRIQDRQGRFAGVLYAAVSAESLQQLFARADVGEHGAISLRTSSLRLVARHAPDLKGQPPPIGSNKVSAELAAQLQARPYAGQYIAETAMDGIERANAYLGVGTFPLVLIAGLATQDFLAGWWDQLRLALLLILLIWAGLGLSAHGLQRAWRREQRSSRDLLAASQRNAGLLHTASDGIHVLDRRGRLLELSASFAAMLGSQREALLGRHVSSWDAGLAPAVLDGWISDLRLGEHRRFETRHRCDDGSLIEVEVAVTAVSIDAQELLYCSARDVSARRQGQRELAQALAEAQDLYDHAPCGYLQLDSNARVQRINRTAAAWLGSDSAEALLGLEVEAWLDDAARADFRRHFEHFKQHGELRDLELSLLPPPGSDPSLPGRRVTLSATALYAEPGHYLSSRVVMHDITELHAARDAERRTSRELRAMLDNRLVGILKLAGRRIVWANQAMSHLFGYPEAELLGRSTRLLYPSEADWDEVGRLHELCVARGEVARSQVRMLTRSGEPRWIELSGMPLDEGRADESIWVLSDITAQRSVQERIAYLGHHDELTGLPNRRLLDDHLALAMGQARARSEPLALGYLDLDGFKAINDHHGHATGDAVLREVAHRLRAALRSSDFASRVGGDEFVLVLPHLDSHQDWQGVAQRLLAELGRPLLVPGLGQPLHIAASLGIALYPDDAPDARSLMQLADAALYEAKAAGKGCVRRHGVAFLPMATPASHGQPPRTGQPPAHPALTSQTQHPQSPQRHHPASA